MIRQLTDLIDKIQRLRQRDLDRDRKESKESARKANKCLRSHCRATLGITLPEDFEGSRYDLFPGIALYVNPYHGGTLMAYLRSYSDQPSAEYEIKTLRDLAYILEARGFALPPK